MGNGAGGKGRVIERRGNTECVRARASEKERETAQAVPLLAISAIPFGSMVVGRFVPAFQLEGSAPPGPLGPF